MKWQQLCNKYPNTWVLVEATVAHSEEHMRIPDELELIEVFDDSPSALERYNVEHKKNRMRELFVFHTSRKQLEIEERRWAGIRA